MLRAELRRTSCCVDLPEPAKGDSPGSDDSRRVSRTDIDEKSSKQHEENGLPDVLMTMSQTPLPDVTRELAEVGAVIRGVKSEAPMW